MILKLLALNVVVMLGVFALVQAIIVAIYCRYMRPVLATKPWHSSDSCAVLMALRGADPHLYRTLLAHLQQRDVAFHLHLIVDSANDPAVAVIRQLPTDLAHRWTMHVLEIDSDHCSLKCLALAQVARRLLLEAGRPKFFAFADGDGLVSQDWLWRLLEPMAPWNQESSSMTTTVGATTGHRWYRCFPAKELSSPPVTTAESADERSQISLGAIVRYFWNLGSLPQMHLYRVVWGGSWAIRADVLEHCGLLESWQKALFEDTQVRTFVEAAGHRVATAPGVLVQSYEPLRVASATRWISRQLLDMRLYHPSFRWTAFHAGFLALLHACILGIAIWASLLQDWWSLGVVIMSLMGYQLFYLIVWRNIERTAQHCLSQLSFEQPIQRETSGSAAHVFWAATGLLLTQVVYPFATVRAILTRTVAWRGIHYRIDSPMQIKRLNYEPFQTDPTETRSDSL
ncbi:MAG: glycosyltransferase [Planctomycetaceae bacterium]|nr:glycosyltransferase [Planctomycetaceae bacterium]